VSSSMPTKYQALAGATVTLLLAVLGGSVVEILKELQIYTQLPNWFKVFSGWLSQIPSSQIFSGLGWAVAFYVLAFTRQVQSRTNDADAMLLYAEIDDFSNRVLYSNDKEIQRFCKNISRNKSTIWLDADLGTLRRRFILVVRGHYGIKILDDPLLHGPLVVDPLDESDGSVIEIISQNTSVKVVTGSRVRLPTARESFRSILDLMKDRIRVLEQKPIQSLKKSESANE
jgi:hypothetical protein